MSLAPLGPPIEEHDHNEASGSSSSSVPTQQAAPARQYSASSSDSIATSQTLTPVQSNDKTSSKGRQDVTEGGNEKQQEEEWGFTKQLKTDQHLLESRDLPPSRSLHLAYKDLCVRGVGSADDVTYAPDVGAIIMPWKNIHYARKAKKLAAARAELDEKKELEEDERLKKKERFLLKDFNGVVKAGEMMLVVGRPGSGCTTFLKALAGLHDGYAGVDGDIYYGDMTGDKALKPYKTDVIFNPEEDIFDPNLTVGRTLDFALRMNTPAPGARMPNEEGGDAMTDVEYRDKMKKDLTDVLGLSHTLDTKVGDQYVRGVSGGEKKRVSIAEVLTSGASVQMWDNATRGLDADTALRYTRVIRALTDIQRNASVVSLYQAGNGIYDQFDKVTVIAEGQLIYYGPRTEARGYFEDMGFVHPDGGNTADFLTSVTALNERQVKDGADVPDNATDLARVYANSEIARRMKAELDEHLGSEALHSDTVQAQEEIQRQKDKRAIKRLPQRANFATQVKAALIRDYQQRWGDQWTFWARQFTTTLQALLAGSTFYMVSDNTGGLFTRGGVIFLTILNPSLISLAETTAAFSGRAVTSKHKAFSMYRPSAVYIAQTIGDLPIFFLQIALYTIIIYFMTGLKRDPGLYFTYLLITYVTTLCTTAFFRFIGYSFGTFENASKVSGFMFSVIVTYAGYIIYTPQMKPWFAWIRWINPIYYAVEALLANELYGLQVECIPPQLAPYGSAEYAAGPAACAIAGAQPGETTLSGTAWMETALSFYKAHVWRNFGIIMAIMIFFIGMSAFAIERIPAAGSTKATLLYKRGGGGRYIRQQKEENEKAKTGGSGNNEGENGNAVKNDEVHAENTVFTWKDLTYTVQNSGKTLTLLDKVSGYCKAGTLTALMGSSGAGKTTLMDVLAARKTEGEIRGEVLMNGRPLPISFQRTTGYCEQVDVHLPQATIREALEFSALLRQPRSVPDKEKLAYVDTIIDLLELHDIEDAMIGTPGAGLGVEQRKRLTIGVELVSKPSLLFLDEPTSGLDGQSSFIIVQFLRKLAAAGQAVLCTIHQPSASLFSQFDQLLLLKQGGKTVYFGSIDHLSEYFGNKGAAIPKDVNPAERMIDIVSGDLSKDRDWAKEWLDSKESKEALEELDRLSKETSGEQTERDDDKYEYASTTLTQLRLVTSRASVQLYRNTEYVTNKVFLHIGSALFNGFSFWMIGNTYQDLQNRLFTVFNFIFVAPGVIAQTQPKFIANRDVFEAREKKAKLYSWWAFCFGEIVAEVPYLLVCAFLYWVCWWPVVGFPFSPYPTGPVFLQMVIYEFLYTGIGQFIAAYAPSATFAALVNPIMIGILVLFCGVLVPQPQIPPWWRYWLYYLNPFNYLVGGLLNPILWDVEVRCSEQEFGVFDPPNGQTCQAYMSEFLQQSTGYLDNPDATSQCRYCSYSTGAEYLDSLNLGRWIYGWRNICLTLLFALSSYGFVFLLLKLRSKQSKKASK